MRRGLSTQYLTMGLVAIAIVPALTGLLARPAQAGFVDAVRGIFGGDSGSGASSRSRGGAIRNEYCKSDEIAASNEEIVALIPDATATTTQANPEIYLYVPFDRERYPQVSLFLDIESSSFSYALPAVPGIITLQIPDTVALASGQTAQWQLRMLCETGGQPEVVATATTEAATPAPSEGDFEIDLDNLEIAGLGQSTATAEGQDQTYVFQEVSGPIQRVEVSPELAETLATTDASLHYQAYLDEGIWLDMVTALADTQSPEWVALLEEFELSGIEPTVQPLR